MMALVLIFSLVAAAVLEAVAPAWAFFGYVHWPLVLGVVIYYTLFYSRETWVIAAILGGFLQDSLGSVPLGFSAFCFLVTAGFIHRFRRFIFLHEEVAHLWIGGAASVVVNMLMLLLLATSQRIQLTWLTVLARVWGAACLGSVFVPLAVILLRKLDRMLGIVSPMES